MTRILAAIVCGIVLVVVRPTSRAQAPASPVLAPDKAHLSQTLNGLDGPGFAIACGEEIVAAGCEEGAIHLWKKDVWMGVRSGEKTTNVLHGHEGPVLALAVYGDTLASAGADGKVLLWDLYSAKITHALGNSGIVRGLAFSPDGSLLATGGEKNIVEIWDVATGKSQGFLEGHTDWINALAFSPDAKQLATGSHDGTVRLWDLATRKQAASIAATTPTPGNMPPLPTNHVLALAFTPDGKQIAFGGTDGQVHLANVADGKLAKSLPGHTSSITALVFHPGGKFLISASKDRTVRLWDATSGQALKTLEGHAAWVQGAALLDQGTRLASVSADKTVKIWDLTASK
ncbi:MAG: WD40 repeat domain-containing protein [Gemmataceae bacterium]